MFAFRLSKKSLLKYRLDEINFYSEKGTNQNRLIREAAYRINSAAGNNKKVGAGFLYSVNLLTEIYKYVISKFKKEYDNDVFKKEFDFVTKTLGAENFVPVLNDFLTSFPPEPIYSGKLQPEEYIWNKSAGRYNYEVELEDSLILFLHNNNPALDALHDLLGVENLSFQNEFFNYIEAAKKFFEDEPKLKENNDLLNFLLQPILNSPDNLQGQLEFIRSNWKDLIADKFEREFLASSDLLREDVIIAGAEAPPPSFVPEYKKGGRGAIIGKSGFDMLASSSEDYVEEENFTPDTDWMPKVVMIAKNTYVWLSQLSKKYFREINRLDQVPDEELQELSKWNINSLWLIGVWERSEASKKIKHLRGNIDAVASAYSLYDYEIASDLGGYEAYQKLNAQAKKFGIRLAADMVPNHTGIYSKWIVEHPDYFIQSSTPPFPGYKFTGANLSPDPNFTIKIEDGYWSNSDAAVVFERIDNRTGERRYIYHGNDGTNMPWNDTAQLDILKHEVREAVIQKIMDVARKFSIIRFDAAMTLTKKHFARLWYPEPGSGGDIPSRADYALTKEEFNKFFPKEFWREVVDRINAEMPETLLLAEAFWLMEGYFVRTLGMHRVYNSAFMNMFMREENQKYRELIKNTLEFEPEILKRYVNFMSNPDEETAIKQFGSGDKYFGVLTMMVTMPGLPMFAHGQIEGYHEKYGMEYKRAYYNEEPNYGLIERHKREIFPLIAKRRLFSEVKNFWLFPFKDNDGNVNENVFAYVNALDDEKALVFYNNKYDPTSGSINFSEKKLTENELIQKSLSEALFINPTEEKFISFKELISKREFLFKAEDFKSGFNISLNGFEYRVFSDFKTHTVTRELNELYSRVGKIGFSSLKEEMVKTQIRPIHDATLSLFDEEIFSEIIGFLSSEGLDKRENLERDISFLTNRFNYLLHQITEFLKIEADLKILETNFKNVLLSLIQLRQDVMSSNLRIDKRMRRNLLLLFEHNYRDNLAYIILLNIRSALEKLAGASPEEIDIYDEILFDDICSSILSKLGKSQSELDEIRTLIKILTKLTANSFEEILTDKSYSLGKQIKFTEKLFDELVDDDLVKEFLRVNSYQGETYYLKENFEELIHWFYTIALIKYYISILGKEISDDEKEAQITGLSKIVNYINLLSEDSGYRLNKLKEKLKF